MEPKPTPSSASRTNRSQIAIVTDKTQPATASSSGITTQTINEQELYQSQSTIITSRITDPSNIGTELNHVQTTEQQTPNEISSFSRSLIESTDIPTSNESENGTHFIDITNKVEEKKQDILIHWYGNMPSKS